jgi:catechol 2,3-dioxygenase-like lactoylglutathione lyase family enzyme
MSDGEKFGAGECTPILFVRDYAEAVAYYTEKLLFRKMWDWDQPPAFGAVAFGKVEIFFSEGGQGRARHVAVSFHG